LTPPRFLQGGSNVTAAGQQEKERQIGFWDGGREGREGRAREGRREVFEMQKSLGSQGLQKVQQLLSALEVILLFWVERYSWWQKWMLNGVGFYAIQ
jgi:hypothetical protein